MMKKRISMDLVCIVIMLFCSTFYVRNMISAKERDSAYEVVQKKFEREYTGKNKTVLLRCDLRYPQFKGIEENASNQVNQIIEKNAIMEFSKNCKEARASIQDTIGDIPLGIEYQAWLPYSYQLTDEVTLNHKDYVSFYYTDFKWFGGAHPDTTIEGFSYNMNTGKQISPSDVLVLDEVGVKTYIANEAAKLYQTTPEIYFKEEIENLKKLDFEYGFYLTNEGVVFFFNPYMIAPYATGVVRIDLKQTENPQLFKAEAPFHMN